MELNETNSSDNLWFILSILFITMFVISFIVNIFLWIIRKRNLLEIKNELQQMQRQQNQQTNVFYGGPVKSTYL